MNQSGHTSIPAEDKKLKTGRTCMRSERFDIWYRLPGSREFFRFQCIFVTGYPDDIVVFFHYGIRRRIQQNFIGVITHDAA